MTQQGQGVAQPPYPREPNVHSGGHQDPGGDRDLPPYEDRQKEGAGTDKEQLLRERGSVPEHGAGPRDISDLERAGYSDTDTAPKDVDEVGASPSASGDDFGRRMTEEGHTSRESLRTAQLFIYTSSDDPPTELVRALRDFLAANEIEIEDDQPAQLGSFRANWRMREKRPAALQKLMSLMQKAELAGEYKYIRGERTLGDEREANAIAAIINSLKDIDEAVVQLSSLFIVKFHNRIIVRVLSEDELGVLGERPDLLESPVQAIFTQLTELVEKGKPKELTDA